MKVKQLIAHLKEYPEDAVIYVEADHGQNPEPAHNIVPSSSEPIYNGEEMNWEKLEGKITAVCIG